MQFDTICKDCNTVKRRKSFEPRSEKTGFLHYAKTKTQISLPVTAKLISAFVFATWIVQSLFYLNPKFQASSHLLWLYSPVCVGSGRKHRRSVFSQRGAFIKANLDYLYKNDPYCLDRSAWANSADSDQTAPRGSVSALFVI